MSSLERLDSALIDALAREAHGEAAALYARAAREVAGEQAAFYWTHARVWALVADQEILAARAARALEAMDRL